MINPHFYVLATFHEEGRQDVAEKGQVLAWRGGRWVSGPIHAEAISAKLTCRRVFITGRYRKVLMAGQRMAAAIVLRQRGPR